MKTMWQMAIQIRDAVQLPVIIIIVEQKIHKDIFIQGNGDDSSCIKRNMNFYNNSFFVFYLPFWRCLPSSVQLKLAPKPIVRALWVIPDVFGITLHGLVSRLHLLLNTILVDSSEFAFLGTFCVFLFYFTSSWIVKGQTINVMQFLQPQDQDKTMTIIDIGLIGIYTIHVWERREYKCSDTRKMQNNSTIG
ncbi:uncharacterized protein BX664DRAFT_317726 [Halteromyces radiatus]|uniref:uncharacterized protein n=1 Tax=Halteromyces radiatus TaxID=101107 RepID=UPI00222043D9|nr:uncharacterized protein BX664DRAFT_317726 [Halteromyces radiatus]KAI8079826.1 hypothetical protein BX664DRAFT_317726 [Halteromyces radiatus]